MDKVYVPEVLEDSNFPTEETTSTSTVASSGVYTPTEIEDTSLPVKKIANELISSVLNTQSHKILGELKFTRMGAIQIGSYEEDETGDVRISPEGIVGRNTQGETTFALDGETGDATFKGIVRAGSLVSGDLVLGGKNNSDGTLTIADSDGNIIILADKLGHHYYSTAGVELIKVDWEGLKAYGNSGNIIKVYPTAGALPFFVLGYNSDENTVSLTTLLGGGDFTTGTLELKSYKGPYIRIGSGTGNQELTLYSDSLINLDSDVEISGDLTVIGTLNATVSSTLYADSADYAYAAGALVDFYDAGAIIYAYKDGSDIRFNASGTVKTAIVPTSQGLKTLYCTESPDVWFMDFYKDKVDPLFMEVTKEPYHEVRCTDGYTQIWGIRKDVNEKRFAPKTSKEFIKNNQFWGQAQYKNKLDDLKTLKKVV